MADSTTVLTGTLVLGALAFKGLDLVKYGVVAFRGPLPMGDIDAKDAVVRSRARDEARNGLMSLLLGCLVGVGIVYAFAMTQLATYVSIDGLTMADMSTASKIVVGLGLTGLAGVLFDGKKALDNTDSASKVKLSLSSERDRQARLDQILSPMAPRPEKTMSDEVPVADVPTEKRHDPDVAWMHEEFDKVIDRMFGSRPTV